HLDGLLDPPMLERLLARGVPLPVTPAKLAHVWPVTSSAGWKAYQDVVAPCLMDKRNQLLPMLEDYTRQLAEQQVTYAEIMLNGLLGLDPDIGKVIELFRVYREAVDRAATGKLRVV